MAAFPAVLDQLTVFQEATKNIPVDILAPMAAHIAGGHGQLFRYTNATEKPLTALGAYIVGQTTIYAWPNQPAGSLVDLPYVAVYIDNAYLQYYQDLTGSGDTIAPVANYPSRIRANNTNYVANGTSYPRASSLGDRDVHIGDAVLVQAGGTNFYSTVAAVIADQENGVVGAATSGASNAATQGASNSASQPSGPTNYINPPTVNVVNYEGSVSSGLHDVYTLTVTQGSVGGDATTARLAVTTSSGADNVASLQPAPFGTATNVGARGLRLTFTNTTTSNTVSGGASPVDFVLNQVWQVTVNEAWTAPVSTSGGSYSGLTTQQYTVKVTRGGLYSSLQPVAAPTTTPTVNAVGGGVSGGSLQAGAYRLRYTWVNANGETTPSPESAVFNVVSGNIPQATIPALPANVTSANIYLTAPGGAAGMEQLYATGVSATTYNLSAAVTNLPPSSTTIVGALAAPSAAPTVNVTGGGPTGGALQAGTYLAKFTFTNSNGESPPSPESASFTVAAGNQPQVTLPALPAGATGISLYITPPGGTTGQEFIQYTTGINTTTYTMAAVAPTLPPSSNTTSPSVSVPAFTPTVNPTAGGSSGGKLPAGTYYLKVTYTGTAGETTPGPESAQFTVAAGDIPEITNVPTSAPTNAVDFNVYLTPVNGASGSEFLYSSNNAFPGGGTYSLATASPTTSPTVPGSNTTNPVVSNPVTAATVSPTGGGSSGGLLPAGTYYLKYTLTNLAGETQPATESSQFTVVAGDIPQATFPALPTNAIARKVYLTPTNGSTNTEILYAAGVTGTTFNLANPLPYGHGPLPAVGSAYFTPANPSVAPTVNPTGGGSTGGNLAAGTYYVKSTLLGSVVGESLASSEVSFTVAAGNIPSVTVPTLPSGVKGYNLYMTQVAGVSGSETLLSTLSNSTGPNITIPVSAGSALATPPPAVTTATASATNPSPPQVTVSTSIGTDFSGPTNVTAANQTITVGTLGITISFTGTGLNLNDVYNIQATAVGVGPYRTLVLNNNLPQALQTASDLSVTLYIQKTSNWELSQQQINNPPNLNWTATTAGLTINANAVATDPTWTKAGVPQTLTVQSGPGTVVYAQYRAWMPTYNNAINTISDPTLLQTVFGYTAEGTIAPVTYPGGPSYSGTSIGIPDPDTVLPYALYKALINANGQPVLFTSLPDPTQLVNWQNVLAALVGLKNVYHLAPLTSMSTVQAAYQAHVDSQAATAIGGEWRVAWLQYVAPTTQDIVFAPIAPATTPTATTTDGNPALGTIAANPSVSGTQYTYVTCTSGNGQFITNGVQAGDQFRTFFSQDAFGNPTWTTFTVSQVVNQDTLILSTGPAAAVTSAQRFEIWRLPTATQVAAACAATAVAANDQRVRYVWPDTINDGGRAVKGHHLCAALAAYASAVAPMQDLRNLAITGFDSPVPRSTQYFNQAQINTLASAGSVVVTSDALGDVFCTVANTTAQTGGLNNQLESVVRNLDALNYLFYGRLQQFFGKANVTPVALQMMYTEIQSGISYGKGVSVNRLGALLVSGSIAVLGQSAIALDRVALQINVATNYPVDGASVTLLV